MKKIVSLLLIVILTIFFVLLFLPKKNIHYKFEELAKMQEVVLSNEELKSRLFGLDIEHAKLYIRGIHIAELSFRVRSFALYNAMDVAPFDIDEDLIHFFPQTIDKINISHSIFTPNTINLEICGDFGEAKGVVNLGTKSLYLEVEPSKILTSRYKSVLRELKKDKEGGYIYEQSL